MYFKNLYYIKLRSKSLGLFLPLYNVSFKLISIISISIKKSRNFSFSLLKSYKIQLCIKANITLNKESICKINRMNLLYHHVQSLFLCAAMVAIFHIWVCDTAKQGDKAHPSPHRRSHPIPFFLPFLLSRHSPRIWWSVHFTFFLNSNLHIKVQIEVNRP